MKRTEAFTIIGANWRLEKIQELHAPGKHPGRPMHVRNTYEGRREIAVPNFVEIGDKGIFFAHHITFMLLLGEWLYICDEQISISSFWERSEL